ncbi:ribosome maturation factor RimM [Dyadobacter fanqingshengii]|uniref:Ribosome maturation factor RimM n=1 Tax=Dyadobacter fanqingshengii TaxID=2906443 RepID=A0A9X1PGA3_9BACT|nr:ribosome maturation factor RimM [Dyadobacter fanqingshengii]MCF0042732.1 ribosome maturation factor RimM [Dyadobacter fanqingshengii]MCF2504497.1 ribosome maturation factor RimM [Dyadobacter fanqingshengii]USJ36045.1 ribosome maturation factor RimM [Dyadobacter fanqingshengii]
MTQDNCYLLGYIVRTHGTTGNVVIFLDVDYPEEYEELDAIYVEIKGELVPYFIENFNLQKQANAIVKFEDINTIEKAQALVGSSLYLSLDELEELSNEEFYYHEIKGFTVVDQTAGELGTVREVYSLNGQDLIAMDYQGVEVLIPTAADIVLKADKENKQLMVNLPEGLLEVYLDNSDSENTPDDAD